MDRVMDSLRDLYYSLQEPTPGNQQKLLKLSLELKKTQNNTLTEQVLLQTSFIRTLYHHYDHHFFSWELNVTILELLLGYLKSCNDKFVCFTTSKAMVSVMRIVPLEILSKMVEDVILIFVNCKPSATYTYTGVYSLQILTELLKSFRKEHSEVNGIKIAACLSLLSSNWSKILAGVGFYHSNHHTTTVLFQLILEQCLSLLMECLRCQKRVVSTDQTTIPAMLMPSLGSLMQPVVESTLTLCKVRFIDILRKMVAICETSTVSEIVADKDFTGLQSYATSLLESWFHCDSGTVYQLFVTLYPTPSIIKAPNSTVKTVVSLERTFLRKYLLLALLFAVSSINATTPSVVKALNRPLLRILCHLKLLSYQFFNLPDHLILLFVQTLILHLVTEEDGCLVRTLSGLLKLSTSPRGKSIPALIEQVCDIHHVFIHFMNSVTFDSSTILDFLISNETNFDLFFCDYLKLISTDDGGTNLTTACQQMVQAQTGLRKCKNTSDMEQDSNEDSSPLLEGLLHCLSGLYTQLDNARSKGLIEGESKLTVISEILQLIEAMA